MNNKELKIKAYKIGDCDLIDQCESIALENHIDNGGTLKYLGLYEGSDYVICCTYKDKVVGYTYLVHSFIEDNDLYLEQIAVKKSFQKMGIGSCMLNYLKSHSKQFSCITSNVREDNVGSMKLHKKNGFKRIGSNQYGITFKKKINKIFSKEMVFENEKQDGLQLDK